MAVAVWLVRLGGRPTGLRRSGSRLSDWKNWQPQRTSRPRLDTEESRDAARLGCWDCDLDRERGSSDRPLAPCMPRPDWLSPAAAPRRPAPPDRLFIVVSRAHALAGLSL